MSPVISVLPSKGPLVLLLPSLGDNQVTVSSAVDEGMSQEPLWTGMSSGGFRAGGFAATSCPWIRRFPTSFQRDWLCLVQPSYFSVTRSWLGRRSCCWGGGEGCGWWDRMLGCGICQHIVPAVPWKHHGKKSIFFCHFRLSQRVPYRPRVKLLPRRRTRRRTDM